MSSLRSVVVFCCDYLGYFYWMDAPGKLIYKSRFPFIELTVGPTLVVLIFLVISIKVELEAVFILIPIIIGLFWMSIFSMIYVYDDHIDIRYPFNPLQKRKSFHNSEIEKLVFSNAGVHAPAMSFYFETINGRKKFSHLFSIQEQRTIIKIVKKLGIEAHSIP